MGTCSQTSAHRVKIAMNGQEYNPRFTCRCFQLISSLNTVQIRHGDVCDDNIGRQFHCLFEYGSTIGNLSHDFKL